MSAREADARVAVDVKALQAAGRLDAARDRYGELVARHQRRASRIAFHYLRDAADADEAVQDAFMKAYTHLGTFREELPFEIWFTRILINGCLDRLKMRRRRDKWIAPPIIDSSGIERHPADFLPARGPSPEEQVLAAERKRAAERRAREAAGAAAAGVHAEPFRRADVPRSERDDGTQRVHRPRAFVQGDSTPARFARARRRARLRQAGGLTVRLVDAVFRQGHLSEQALVEAVMTGERPAHLDRCDLCADRAVELGRWLDDVRGLGLEAADEVFTPERLAAQHAQILRKIEQADEPSRVIAFPKPTRSDAREASTRKVAPAWVGIAAAAGLALGVVGGQVSARMSIQPVQVTVQSPTHVTDTAHLQGTGVDVARSRRRTRRRRRRATSSSSRWTSMESPASSSS